MSSQTFVAENRLVFTYEVDGRDVGILTGYEFDTGFFLEHVVAFPGHGPYGLSHLVDRGIATAWERGYLYISLFIEHQHPRYRELSMLARRHGFHRFGSQNDRDYFVLHRRP